MLSKIVESVFEPLNFIFVIVIGAIFALSLISLVFRAQKGWLYRLRSVAPGLLTGIGILGTFLGIFVGLLSFDVSTADTIQRGVPALLEGMKTAFLTSVAGLSAAMTLKLGVALFERQAARRGASAADIVEAISELKRDSVEEARQLRIAVVGDGTSSVVTQLRVLREESREGREQVVRGLNDLGKLLAESATKALIAALEDAIKDFNTKISEQFGSNFAQLNTAVGRLLEWQEAYRLQLTQMMADLERSTVAAQGASAALERTAEQSRALVAAADALSGLLSGLAAVRSELDQRLAAFATMAERAGQAIPRIEENLARLTDGMEREVTKAITASAAIAEAHRDQAARTATQYEKLGAEVDRLVRESTDRLRDTMAAFQQQGTQLVADVAKRIEESHKAEWERLNAAVSATSQQTTEQINRTFSELDKALQQELTNALQALGGRLAAVTTNFANDFARAIGDLRDAAQRGPRP